MPTLAGRPHRLLIIVVAVAVRPPEERAEEYQDDSEQDYHRPQRIAADDDGSGIVYPHGGPGPWLSSGMALLKLSIFAISSSITDTSTL